jgi:hypothetical protein
MKRSRRRSYTGIAAGLVVCFCSTAPSGGNQEPVQKLSAKEIAKGWQLPTDPEKFGKVSGIGATPDHLGLFSMTTKIPRGSFEEAWTFYTKKCGAKAEYYEETIASTNGKTKEGVYIITENREKVTGQHATFFTYMTREYTVAVHIRRDDKMNLYVALSVALH